MAPPAPPKTMKMLDFQHAWAAAARAIFGAAPHAAVAPPETVKRADADEIPAFAGMTEGEGPRSSGAHFRSSPPWPSPSATRDHENAGLSARRAAAARAIFGAASHGLLRRPPETMKTADADEIPAFAGMTEGEGGQEERIFGAAFHGLLRRPPESMKMGEGRGTQTRSPPSRG
jgi:hypothetical protein